MAGPQTPAVGSTALPPISGTPFVDSRGVLTVAGLNLIQQIWAGVFGTGGVQGSSQSGDIKPIAGSATQSGWLLCDGTAYPNSSYPNLFAAIGTTWGTAGSGTFRVPNLVGKFLLGTAGSYPVGATGGGVIVDSTGNTVQYAAVTWLIKT